MSNPSVNTAISNTKEWIKLRLESLPANCWPIDTTAFLADYASNGSPSIPAAPCAPSVAAFFGRIAGFQASTAASVPTPPSFGSLEVFAANLAYDNNLADPTTPSADLAQASADYIANRLGQLPESAFDTEFLDWANPSAGTLPDNAPPPAPSAS